MEAADEILDLVEREIDKLPNKDPSRLFIGGVG